MKKGSTQVKQIFRNTWSVLDKKEKRQFMILVLGSIIISIADILALVALLWIINFYIQTGNSGAVSFLPGWMADKESIALIAVYFILFSIKNIAGFLLAKAHYAFTGRVAVRISGNMLLSFQQADFREFIHTDSSVLIRKIALQPFEFSQHVLSGIQQIITQSFLIGISIIAILVFNAKLFLLLLVILLPPVVIVFRFIRKRMAFTRKNLQETNERSYQYMLDSLKGWVESNIFQRNDFFLDRFIQQRRMFSAHLFNSLSLQNLPSRIIEIFAVLGLFVLLVIAKWPGQNDRSILITIGAFMAAAYKIIPGIVKMINLGSEIKAYQSSPGELMPPLNSNNIDEKKTVVIDSMTLEKISFSYPERQVLKDLSFSLQKGDILGISGVSGRGKTTVLNLILGFLSPSSGEVFINCQPMTATIIRQYWPSISYVKQQSFFIYDSILRNITFEEKDYDKEALAFAMKVSGTDKLVVAFPEGLDKIITENGKNISGGQQQRIAIARAVYKKADLILLDEPFNELDDASTLLILEQLKELAAAGKIIVLVTHDKKSLNFCNQIISLDEQ